METNDTELIDPIDVLHNTDLITNKKSDKILDYPENLGERLGKLLMENAEAEKTGLLVDWLTSVELEIASIEGKKLQVFKKKYYNS